jgi:hypothetical protein
LPVQFKINNLCRHQPFRHQPNERLRTHPDYHLPDLVEASRQLADAPADLCVIPRKIIVREIIGLIIVLHYLSGECHKLIVNPRLVKRPNRIQHAYPAGAVLSDLSVMWRGRVLMVIDKAHCVFSVCKVALKM